MGAITEEKEATEGLLQPVYDTLLDVESKLVFFSKALSDYTARENDLFFYGLVGCLEDLKQMISKQSDCLDHIIHS